MVAKPPMTEAHIPSRPCSISWDQGQDWQATGTPELKARDPIYRSYSSKGHCYSWSFSLRQKQSRMLKKGDFHKKKSSCFLPSIILGSRELWSSVAVSTVWSTYRMTSIAIHTWICDQVFAGVAGTMIYEKCHQMSIPFFLVDVTEV